MQNSQITTIIKSRCKEKNISIAQLLLECEITKSFVYDLEKRNTSPSADRLVKIADRLDCSVDYLLGRTDNPNISQNYSNNNISYSSNIAFGEYSAVENNGNTEVQDDEMTIELVKAFKSLPFSDKMEIMNLVLEKTKK